MIYTDETFDKTKSRQGRFENSFISDVSSFTSDTVNVVLYHIGHIGF